MLAKYANTLDRVTTILGKLDQNIRVSIEIEPRRRAKRHELNAV
jgi:hypothetical protein